MLNIMLMAGSGKRFSDAGYAIPKPLLPVSGKPMIVRVCESAPPSDDWLFVIRQEYKENNELFATLKTFGKNVSFVVDPNPAGQLSSCLVARDRIDKDEPFFVGACDFGMVYNKAVYEKLIDPADENRPDIIVWSFTRQPNITRNPTAWGYVKRDENNGVSGVSVKVPISDDPYNDHVITGDFTFRSGKTFLRVADELIRRDSRVKGEFYIDSMIGLAVEMGYKVVSFPVDRYIGWGVPADYEEYLETDEK